MQIRTAVAADNSAARSLVQQSLAGFGMEADFATLDAAIGALGMPDSPNEIELVVVLEGEVAGCLAIQRKAETCGKLFGFHVDARRQGRGAGRVLLSAGMAEAARRGYTRLELDTCAAMQAAVHLYEALGWVRGPDPLPEAGADRSYTITLPPSWRPF